MAQQEYPSHWTEEDISSVQPISQRELRRRRRAQTKRQDGNFLIGLLTSRGREKLAEDEQVSTYVVHHRRRILDSRGKMGSR